MIDRIVLNTKMKTEPNDIDLESVESSILRYEQDAVDRECGECHYSLFEQCLLAILFLAVVAVWTFTFCEIVRIIRTWGI